MPEREDIWIAHSSSINYERDRTSLVNKADLERALKKTTGAALKPVVVVTTDGTVYHVTRVHFDTETNRVVLVVE